MKSKLANVYECAVEPVAQSFWKDRVRRLSGAKEYVQQKKRRIIAPMKVTLNART